MQSLVLKWASHVVGPLAIAVIVVGTLALVAPEAMPQGSGTKVCPVGADNNNDACSGTCPTPKSCNITGKNKCICS